MLRRRFRYGVAFSAQELADERGRGTVGALHLADDFLAVVVNAAYLEVVRCGLGLEQDVTGVNFGQHVVAEAAEVDDAAAVDFGVEA